MGNETKTAVAACDICGALSLVPTWTPVVIGHYVGSCEILRGATICTGVVRVLGILTMEAPLDA